jgi:hypothetical protein
VCWETFFAKGRVSGSRIQQRESCSAAFPKPVTRERVVEQRVRGEWYLLPEGISTRGSSPHWMKADQRSLRMVAGPSAPGCTAQSDGVGDGRAADEQGLSARGRMVGGWSFDSNWEAWMQNSGVLMWCCGGEKS